jgi:hypothetical protein
MRSALWLADVAIWFPRRGSNLFESGCIPDAMRLSVTELASLYIPLLLPLLLCRQGFFEGRTRQHAGEEQVQSVDHFS